jgi:hypothetical protein
LLKTLKNSYKKHVFCVYGVCKRPHPVSEETQTFYLHGTKLNFVRFLSSLYDRVGVIVKGEKFVAPTMKVVKS